MAAKSLQNLFELWYETYCVKNKKGHHEIKRSFEIHIFQRIGELLADKLTLHEWLDISEEQAEAYEKWCARLFKIVGIETPAPAKDSVLELDARRFA